MSYSRKPYLSQKSLKAFMECPRCFYLDKVKGMKLPYIMPSLPEGMDRIMKLFFDVQREGKEIPENIMRSTGLKGIGLYKNVQQLDEWRNYKQGLKYEDKAGILMGAIDDLCVQKTKKGELIVPFDFKTRGSIAMDGYAERYYKFQFDVYDYLFQKLGFKTAGFGIACIITPEDTVSLNDATCMITTRFNLRYQLIKTTPEIVEPIYKNACAVLASEVIPKPSLSCDVCKYVLGRKG